MGQVNSHGERRSSERDSEPTARAKVHSCPRKTAEFLGFSAPIIGRRDCPRRRCWRSDRSCRQTLSGPFSMAYEPHKLRWMLPRESWACCGGLHWCTVGGLARCLQSGLRSGPRAGRQHQPRDPYRRRRAWHSNGAQRLRNDALIFPWCAQTRL